MARIIELPELGVERSFAQQTVDALRGKTIINEATGIRARLSSSARGKLVSNKATGKSKANGFSQQQHNALVANIAEIYQAAALRVSRPDRDGDVNILSIKRFVTKVKFGRRLAAAWITVKESKMHGHHIYSVEAIKLEALDRIVEVVSGNTPHASSAPTRGMIAFFPRCVNAVLGKIFTHRSLLAATLAAALLALAPLAARAETRELDFRGQKITVDGLQPGDWEYLNGAPNSGTEELVLIYKDSSAPGTMTLPYGVEARVLVVGGGGAGGYGTTGGANPGGGGGGGQVVTNTSPSFAAGTYTITVGKGGAPKRNLANNFVYPAGNGENGYPSLLTFNEVDLIKALGGGGGGAKGDGNGGDDVATGGGGGGQIKPGDYGQGGDGKFFKGGNAASNNRSGGGAGAGGAGTNATTSVAGAGGIGIGSDIWPDADGNPRKYGGGGGGAQSSNAMTTPIGVGVDGGGDGGRQNFAGVDGDANTGGGGGGGGRGTTSNMAPCTGGAGGSGVVIIRITYIEVPMEWKEIPLFSNGKIFVDKDATWKRVNPSDLHSDIIITYSNALSRGGLRFFDPAQPELPPVWATARILTVGGGGGGGMIDKQNRGGAGGGGAGGFLEESGFVFSTNVEYSITVGKGGRGGAQNEETGANGENSSVKTNGVSVLSSEAIGGGGGGAHSPGLDGGSGGGGSRATTKDESDTYDRPGGSGVLGQGYAGGNGSGTFNGAGGGGAGGAGFAATSDLSGGNGGVGRPSDITGSMVMYAGGGGGVFVNAADLTSFKYRGGTGGEGGGGNGAGVDGGSTGKELNPIPAGDGVNGTGSGGGGGVSYQGAPETAGNGGSGVVIIRLSRFVVESIPVPAPKNYVYDGTEKVGVEEFFAYTFKETADVRTHHKGVDSYVYEVTLNIADDAPYGWSDVGKDDPRYRGDRVLHWKITPRAVVVPKPEDKIPGREFVFTTTGVRTDSKNAVPWADSSGFCWTNITGGARVRFCSLADYIKGDAGNYKFTATLANDYASEPNVTNFTWYAIGGTGEGTGGGYTGDDPRLKPRTVDWSIAQAQNAITVLTLENWQEDTVHKDPASDWTWRAVAADYAPTGTTDQVLYQVGTSPTGPWGTQNADFSEIAPTEAGEYWLRASVVKDSNHNPGNWVAAERVIRFCVWRHPSKTLTDFVDITTSGATAILSVNSALEDFPVLVRLREPVDGGKGGGLPGFTYARAGDGSQIRFVAISNINLSAVAEADKDNPLARDSLLPYEIDVWNPSGESLVWVRVPKMWKGSTFRMYWRRNPSETVKPDLLASDVWASGYVGVWHMNEPRESNDGYTFANSTALGGAMDASATGKVAVVTAKSGGPAALATAGDIVAPNYNRYLEGLTGPFTATGWYRADNYASGNVMFTGTKLGGQATDPYKYATGWCWMVPNNAGQATLYANGADTIASQKTVSNFKTTWHQLGIRFSATGSSQTGYYVVDGTESSQASRTVSLNDLPFQVLGTGFAADEVRLAKVNRTATWTKEEYNTIATERYCAFGLVNQMQSDGTRAWINWWSREPTIKRYWDKGTLTKAQVDAAHGALCEGVVTNKFVKMPEETEVVFPDAYATGAYTVEFYMFNAANGTPAYPGVHLLYDGSRTFDLEIVDHAPTPIDPGGPEGATVSGRVLLANDDTNEVSGVSGQAWWRKENGAASPNPYWVHTGATPPDLGVNLLPGSIHALRHVAPAAEPEYEGQLATNELWTLTEVYVGNLMTNDDAVADGAALSNRWNALPWRETGVANSAEGAPFARHEVGHMFLRNLGVPEAPEDGLCAEIRSQVYTNGIGTVYFDAVNVYAGNDVKPEWSKLVVEVTDGSEVPVTNIVEKTVKVTQDDGTEVDVTTVTTNIEYVTHWERVPLLPLYVNGASIAAQATTDELNVLNVKNGGKLGPGNARFYRVLAKVNRRAPTRFRIRRTSAKVDAGGIPTDIDDVEGWILVDNVVASWPAPLPSLVPTGDYDASRHANKAPVLGVEGAFSVPYPSVNDDFFANVRLTGGEVTNVASARMHYRWRYADTEFVPAQLNGRDNWSRVYFNVTNASFSTVSPLVYNHLPGDIEYYFDLTAFVPYYSYVDYSGCTFADKTAEWAKEEPDKNSPACSQFGLYPSHGTNWFVRIREFPSAKRGWTLYTKTSEGGRATAHPMEMLGATDWRACVVSTAAVERLYFRFESETPSGPQTDGIHTATNFWLSESSDALPKRLLLEGAGSANRWATVPCDAKSGYLVFQVDEVKENVMVARADWQDFNLWSSGVTTNGLFAGSSVETNSSSSVTREYDATVGAWPVSVATNSAWSEDFAVTTGQVASVVYPRNEPFASRETQHGWTVDNAMWTYGKWSLQNKQNAAESFGDDSAVQLEGRGKGRLSLTGKTDMPDGLDTVVFHARIAQYNDADTVSYYDKYRLNLDDLENPVTMPKDFKNYTFATCAALTEKGVESYDGDGSVSLFAYYDRGKGFYEFRVSRGWNSTSVRLALFRWTAIGGQMKAEKLLDANSVASKRKNFFDYGSTDTDLTKGANIGRLVKGVKTPLGGLFISAMESGGTTLVTAGLCESDASTVTGPEGMSGQKFACLTYKDSKQERLTSGTFGVMSANCPAVFVKPACYLNGISSFPPSKNDVLESATGQEITFNQTPRLETADLKQGKSWSLALGRVEMLKDHTDCWGLQAAAVQPQKVIVQVAEHIKDAKGRDGLGPWTDVETHTVKSYTSDVFPTLIRDARTLDVRLQMAGTSDDVRTDVAVNDIELTQWNGQWTENWDNSSPIWRYLSDAFVYTSAWIVEDARGKACRLQPSRARTATTPVSVRTPLMRGLGLLHFKWRNADPRAKLKVQVNEIATENTVKQLTESIAGSGQGQSSWETVETLDFAELGTSGSKSIYLNRRYSGFDERGVDWYKGMIRLVVDEAVEQEARARAKTDERYGSIDITEMFSWDLPEYDRHSWSGWNFRCAGWDGADPDPWANLTDGFRGLSGLLNNTLDESTLADREKGHYDQHPPHVQSPAFLTNCVGAVSFRARLYDPDDLFSAGYAAVVTVYGNNTLNEKGEPVETAWKAVEGADVLISNRVYTTHTVKLSAASGYKAIRLGVKGVKGVVATGTPVYDPPLRVAVDDICIWERQAQSLTFRKKHVRPFRDAAAVKGTAAVADIDGINEQPLLGEAFGFQAEVEVQDAEEVLVDDPAHPITVDLWYYQGAEPWGWDNWKTNPAVVKVTLKAADGTNFIYRSTADKPASLCPPQLTKEGETYRIVQYHAVANFYDREGQAASHDLLREEWPTPEWYAGFADPNASHGDFSAYTMLERIAPKRAWINEISLAESTSDRSYADQWIEIAVPSGVDMTGWKLKLYDLNYGYVADLMTFGNGCPASKQVSSDPSHYDFYVVKGPRATLAADASWKSFTSGSVAEGKLNWSQSYGFELVRPTGIVEHDVVAQGWNQYWDAGYDFAWMYDGTNLVRKLTETTGREWVWADEDDHTVPGATVGVVTNQGMKHVEWKAPMGRTPGALNEGQYIDPLWYVNPNGGYVWIYSTVLGAHMRQIIGGETNTIGTLTVPEGTTTNIVYEVDRWYRLGDRTVTPADRTAFSEPVVRDGKSYYTLTMSSVSNDQNRIDIQVSAKVADEVEAMIDPAYTAYRPAIMKWLERGVTGDGTPFANPDGPLKPGYYRGNNPSDPLPESEDYELGLVGLYWLDLDPTAGGWELWGGMGEKDGGQKLGPVNCDNVRENAFGDRHTNILTTVWLELKNEGLGLDYPPYRLQGLNNEQSDQWPGTWTSVTFQVAMQMANASGIESKWRSMRYFVFGADSFRAATDEEAPFAARIEVTDPFSRQSPAWEWGWWKYSDRGLKPFTQWRLNGDVTPGGISTLHKDEFLAY